MAEPMEDTEGYTIPQLQEAIGASLIELLDRCIAIRDVQWEGKVDLIWIRDCATWLKENMTKAQAEVERYHSELRGSIRSVKTGELEEDKARREMMNHD